jgi:hypothetical protein
MLERIAVRLAPLTNRTAEYGPAVPACCNVCRTCTTTNLVGLAIGGLSVGGAGIWRFARRARRSSPLQSRHEADTLSRAAARYDRSGEEAGRA